MGGDLKKAASTVGVTGIVTAGLCYLGKTLYDKWCPATPVGQTNNPPQTNNSPGPATSTKLSVLIDAITGIVTVKQKSGEVKEYATDSVDKLQFKVEPSKALATVKYLASYIKF